MNRTKNESKVNVDVTLYDIIQNWMTQPWNGKCYLNIAEQLWELLEAADLIEGLFGMSATLLESCILDAMEGLNKGILDEKQAVERLADLLDNSDFTTGARVIEMRVGANPDIKITNIDHLQEEDRAMDFRIPRWWKRSVRSYWLLIGVVPFVSMLMVYVMLANLGTFLPSHILAYVAITPLGYASSYYIRTIPSRRLWRAIAILMGSCFIGLWFIMLPLLLIFGPLIRFAPWWPWWLGMLVFFIGPLVLGGFIGDWIGRRNDYRPYM
ncbi:MAG: hypothetical protein ACXADC_16995 [Candidatus Thorarchaeota archaeon]|jgi:hypothetical protein